MHTPLRTLLVCFLALFAACGGSGDDRISPAPEVEALVRGFIALTEAELIDEVDRSTILSLVGGLVAHWDDTVPAKVPPFLDTEIRSHGAFNVVLDQDALDAFFSLFPLGKDDEDNPTLQVLGANSPLPMGTGTYHIVHLRVMSPLAINVADPTLLFEYGFVFDSDGSATDSYGPSEPENFYEGSDRWYEVTYSNAQGWRLTAYTASTTGTGDSEVTTVTEVESAAKVIFSGDTMLLLVPAGEFGVAQPDYRVTSFVHDGDFGIPAPHSWSGNAEPRVVEGLQRYPN